MSDRTHRAEEQVQAEAPPTRSAMREVVAAALALDRASKDFARETGYREALELAVEVAGPDTRTGRELREELRDLAWRSTDGDRPFGVGPVRDRRDGYALAAERLVRAFDAVGLHDEYAAYAGVDTGGARSLPAGFRSFGTPMA